DAEAVEQRLEGGQTLGVADLEPLPSVLGPLVVRFGVDADEDGPRGGGGLTAHQISPGQNGKLTSGIPWLYKAWGVRGAERAARRLARSDPPAGGPRAGVAGGRGLEIVGFHGDDHAASEERGRPLEAEAGVEVVERRLSVLARLDVAEIALVV